MKARANRHRSESSTVLKITEEGALFRSYRDGRKVLLTPESSVQAQKGRCADRMTGGGEWGLWYVGWMDGWMDGWMHTWKKAAGAVRRV